MKLQQIDEAKLKNMSLSHDIESKLDLRVRQVNNIINSVDENNRLQLTAEIIRDIASTNGLNIGEWFNGR